MNDAPYIAEVAAVIGDPARANMLTALLDGQALTASELAVIAGVMPPTASSHLSKLVAAGLVTQVRQGRHRYFRLAHAAVAEALEALMVLSQQAAPRRRPPGPRDQAMRHARSCYRHLAGTLGVAVAEALVAKGYLEPAARDFAPTQDGAAFFATLGIDLGAVRRNRRALTRPCLDWSERRPHVGGALGDALLTRFIDLDWLRRDPGSRVIHVGDSGRDSFRTLLGIAADGPGAGPPTLPA
ncbi:MAG: ArsR/SmtB family transcription factor [Inquilinaceae bacterium]